MSLSNGLQNHPQNIPPIPQPTTPSKHRAASNRSTSVPETPRRRNPAAAQRLQGIKTNLPANLAIKSICSRLKTLLQLSYTPDDWQLHLVRRIIQGYDSIFCAGTGYGKSLVFDGLAVLGGRGKLIVVICPLKALEHDQASQATSKGIEAVVINEDTTATVDLWKRTRTSAAMVYMSPEMALSESFQKLWKDLQFRTRLTGVIVDEAHA